MIEYNAWGELLIKKFDCRLQFVFVIEVPCNVQETVMFNRDIPQSQSDSAGKIERESRSIMI